MKGIVLSLLVLVGSAALAREVHSELKIVKGPYNVPAVNGVFNVLGSDFKGEGIVALYMTETTIDLLFPRTDWLSLQAVADQNGYFYSTGSEKIKVRVGFEGEKLSWFFSRGEGWSVTIAQPAQEAKVTAASFAQMDEEQLLSFAQKAFAATDAGALESPTISRNGDVLTMKADIMQMGQNDDDPVKVGDATIVFTDVDGARTIKATGTVTGRRR